MNVWGDGIAGYQKRDAVAGDRGLGLPEKSDQHADNEDSKYGSSKDTGVSVTPAKFHI